MSLNVAYTEPPVVESLRRDWAGIPWSFRAEKRWIAPRTWGMSDHAWARGPGLEMLVDAETHGRLGDILRLVRGIDAEAYGWLRAETDGGEWTPDLPRRWLAAIVSRMRRAGIPEDGPTWIAAGSAARRAATRVKDRVGSLRKGDAYGWTRPYGPFDVVATARLPFGAWRARPLRSGGDGRRYGDDELLGWFEIRDALKWKAPRSGVVDVRPENCAYAECALLSGGWAIRFVEARGAAGNAPPPFV